MPRCRARTGFVGVTAALSAFIGWAHPSLACQCASSEKPVVVLPPAKNADGTRFLAPTNTKVWVFEAQFSSAPKRSYFLTKHGESKRIRTGGPMYKGATWPQGGGMQYEVTQIRPGGLDPNQAYDVVEELGAATKVIASFWTGAHDDTAPPVLDDGVSCTGFDGHRPSDNCDSGLPSVDVQLSARDDNTPADLLLYSARLRENAQRPLEESPTPPVLKRRPGVLRLSQGELCEPGTIRLPEPFESGALDFVVMDLAENVSKRRSCALVGPQTYESRALLERARGCPPIPERVCPACSPAIDYNELQEARDKKVFRLTVLVATFATVSTLLATACLVLARRLRRSRRPRS